MLLVPQPDEGGNELESADVATMQNGLEKRMSRGARSVSWRVRDIDDAKSPDSSRSAKRDSVFSVSNKESDWTSASGNYRSSAGDELFSPRGRRRFGSWAAHATTAEPDYALKGHRHSVGDGDRDRFSGRSARELRGSSRRSVGEGGGILRKSSIRRHSRSRQESMREDGRELSFALTKTNGESVPKLKSETQDAITARTLPHFRQQGAPAPRRRRGEGGGEKR